MFIYVMRHGIAHDRLAPDCPPDPERALTPEGIEKTTAAARGLKAFRPEITHLYSSPWLRAAQTMEIAQRELGLEALPVTYTETLLPDSRGEDIARLLRKDRPRGALLTGHGPNVDLVVTWLLTGRKVEQTGMKKASVALLETTDAVRPGEAELVWLIPPKALRALA